MSQLLKFRRVPGKSIAFFASDDTQVVINNELIGELLMECIQTRKNTRVCFHVSPGYPYHDMLIVEAKGIPTLGLHRHPKKAESIQMLRGKMQVEFHNQDPAILNFFDGIYIPSNQWHSTTPLDDFVVYRETKLGPFDPRDNQMFEEETQS